MGSRKYWREDIIAGLTVACVAIPLSLAIAMASSVPPGVGLVSAIIGGLIAAVFGGTRVAVTGPTATMAIVIASSVENYGLTGLLVIGIACGILQIICGLSRLGRFAKLVPLPVISAFTAGIGFIIFIGQLPKALQLPAPPQDHVMAVIKHIGVYIIDMNPMAFVLALITLIILKISPRYFPKFPTPILAAAVPTIIVSFFHLSSIKLIGTIPHELSLPSLPDFASITNWKPLMYSALEVFALASLETLLSSSAVDAIGKGDLHNPNQELIGQGLANIGASLFGGIPVAGVMARSSINLAAGAKTRRSAIIHSLVIVSVIYLCPHLIEIIPIPALAGILLGAALSMMNPREIIEFWRNDKAEVLVYVTTFVVIVTADLIDGVQAGIIMAFLIVGLRMLTTKANVKLWATQEVLRISLSGSMTFWSFEKLERIQEYIVSHVKVKFVIFELDDLRGIDSTGISHFLKMINVIDGHGIKVILHAITKEQAKLLSNTIGDKEKPYFEAITESDVKDILESFGVEHSAQDLLRQGMGKFLGQYVSERRKLLDTLSKVQKPHTLLITCSDSRLNPNAFLSAGLGELFIVRNVGNVVPPFNEDNIGFSEGAAIDFALSKLAIRNVVLCAHTECGAINASISNQEIASPNLRKWLGFIQEGFVHKKPIDVYQGVKFNALNQVENLKTYPIVKELLAVGALKISVWVYDVKTAHILEWDTIKNKFECLSSNKLEEIR